MGHTVKLNLYDLAGAHYTIKSTAVDTSATGCYLVSLAPVTVVGDPLNGRVTESMVIHVQESSLANLRTKLAAIFDFCDQVRRFEAGENTQFGRISIQPGGSGNTFLSRLYDIQATVSGDIYRAEWANTACDVTFIYERDGWWEDATLRLLTLAEGVALTNKPGSNLINLSATVDGDVPAPINIEIENNYNNTSGIKGVYVGGAAVSGSGVVPQLVYEAEVGSGGTPGVDATCSDAGVGTQCNALTVGTSELGVLSWNINDPEKYGGLWYRVIGRWATTTNIGSVKFRWKLLSGAAVIWSGNAFLLANSTNLVQDMGAIKLPPAAGWTGDLTLSLSAVSTTGAGVTVTLDYIHLLASGAQAAVGYGAVEYETFLDVRSGENLSNLPVNNKIFQDWYTLWVDEFMGYPGLYQRIALILLNESGDAEIARTCVATLTYRPRYRSVGE